jgi:F0F1-type ATP synthase assembly protein I
MKMIAPSRSPHTGSNQGWAVISTLLGGFVVWGGIGWLLDRWWETRLMTPIGLIVGMALGIYAVVARAIAEEPGRPVRDDTNDEPPPAGTRRETECP